MNNNYIYDENQSSGHGFSFSLKPGMDQISPRLQNFQPISERSHESSMNYKSSMSSSVQKARAFNLAPELTLDDLREKLRNDVDFQVKKTSALDDLSSLKSSLHRIERPIESKDLLSSMSSQYLGSSRFKGNSTERQYGIKDTPISNTLEDNDTSRPFFRSPPGESLPWDTKPSVSSPLHARSLSSQLRSPTKAQYNWNRDSSANRYSNTISSALPATDTYTRFDRKENFNPSYSARDDTKNPLARTRSPTPTKGVSPLLNPRANSHLGSSYLGSSTYSSKDPQQDLKEKLEQFDKKLAEIQGEFIHSKSSSQDPYKISLNSMKALPKDDLDGLSSKLEERSKRPVRGINDENHKDLGNQDDKDKPLQMDNLISSHNSKLGTQASTGSLRKDYTQGFKEIKKRYSDMFMPKDMKTLTNPYKILKQRYEEKFDKTVKTYLAETAVLTNELNQNLLNVKPN